MIQSKKDLKDFLKADRIALGRKHCKASMFDTIYQFQIALRKYEYAKNCEKGIWGGVKIRLCFVRYFVMSVVNGYSIPPNVFGKGLSIAHRGTIIVNSHSKVGDNCRLHACVNIGTIPGIPDAAPTIGNDCYIAPGAKIYGPIKIADDVVIGANAVVNKSFDEGSITIAGAPARKISDKGRIETESVHRD